MATRAKSYLLLECEAGFPVRARGPCRCPSRRGTGLVTIIGGVSMRIRVAAVRGAAVGWWLTLVRAAKQVWTNQSTRPIRACCCLIGWLRCTRGQRGARSGCRSPDQRAGSHQLRRSAAGALLQCLHGREAASGPLRLGNARGVMRRFGGALVRDARRGRWRAPVVAEHGLRALLGGGSHCQLVRTGFWRQCGHQLVRFGWLARDSS